MERTRAQEWLWSCIALDLRWQRQDAALRRIRRQLHRCFLFRHGRKK